MVEISLGLTNAWNCGIIFADSLKHYRQRSKKMKNDVIFSETEDTKLKQFLTGSRIYSQLAVAIISALVVVFTTAGLVGVYRNCKQAENLQNLTGLDVSGNLNGQYVEGGAYKFLGKVGHIAETEAAATHIYYFMYIDAADENQYLTLVQVPKDMTKYVDTAVQSYLSYAQKPESGLLGGSFESIAGRFKNMTSDEATLMKKGISGYGLTQEKTIDYTLKLAPLPKKSDTVGYWFLVIPFGIAMVVSIILFLYGLKLEEMREEANKSPYPYQNRKKK